MKFSSLHSDRESQTQHVLFTDFSCSSFISKSYLSAFLSPFWISSKRLWVKLHVGSLLSKRHLIDWLFDSLHSGRKCLRWKTHGHCCVSMVHPSLSLSLALWPSGRLAWRRLAFLELGSIFNRVAPLPDGPAIYGPERGARLELTECTGRRGWGGDGGEERRRWQHDGRVLSKMKGARDGGVERDGRDLEVVEDKEEPECLTSVYHRLWLRFIFLFIFFFKLTSCDGVTSATCSGLCNSTRVWSAAFRN